MPRVPPSKTTYTCTHKLSGKSQRGLSSVHHQMLHILGAECQMLLISAAGRFEVTILQGAKRWHGHFIVYIITGKCGIIIQIACHHTTIIIGSNCNVVM
jgi:hypothetical protein